MKKKLFTFALCIIMVAAIAVPAFAAEPPQWSEGDTTVIDLTYEELIWSIIIRWFQKPLLIQKIVLIVQRPKQHCGLEEKAPIFKFKA